MSVIMVSVMAPYLTTILSNRFDVQRHLDLDLAIHWNSYKHLTSFLKYTYFFIIETIMLCKLDNSTVIFIVR
jgi:hypothetical protein